MNAQGVQNAVYGVKARTCARLQSFVKALSAQPGSASNLSHTSGAGNMPQSPQQFIVIAILDDFRQVSRDNLIVIKELSDIERCETVFFVRFLVDSHGQILLLLQLSRHALGQFDIFILAGLITTNQ